MLVLTEQKRDVLVLVAEVAEALILHRPAEGTVALVDFQVAEAAEAESALRAHQVALEGLVLTASSWSSHTSEEGRTWVDTPS